MKKLSYVKVKCAEQKKLFSFWGIYFSFVLSLLEQVLWLVSDFFLHMQLGLIMSITRGDFTL